MMPRFALIALASLPLAACANPPEREANIRAPAATAIGEPVNCINANTIRHTRVHDDYTIDFHMNGGRIYRNTLPMRCGGLGFEQRFIYERSTNQLCNTDTITVLNAGGTTRGATCGLGMFVPVELANDAEDDPA